MQRALVLLFVAGCWQNRSPAGTFLTDVHVDGDRLVSVACDVDFTTTHTLDGKAQGLDASNCSTSREPFPSDTPAAIFAPAECRDAIEAWQLVAAATPSKRERVWRALSPRCRQLVTGDAP